MILLIARETCFYCTSLTNLVIRSILFFDRNFLFSLVLSYCAHSLLIAFSFNLKSWTISPLVFLFGLLTKDALLVNCSFLNETIFQLFRYWMSFRLVAMPKVSHENNSSVDQFLNGLMLFGSEITIKTRREIFCAKS